MFEIVVEFGSELLLIISAVSLCHEHPLQSVLEPEDGHAHVPIACEAARSLPAFL